MESGTFFCSIVLERIIRKLSPLVLYLYLYLKEIPEVRSEIDNLLRVPSGRAVAPTFKRLREPQGPQ